MEKAKDDKTERLQKIISESGIASRRRAEEMIAAGRVKVNGRLAQLGDRAVPGRDKVTVDGALAKPAEEKIYIALNKPRGYVTTLSDERGRKCVTELLPAEPRVFPVGRLDRDSEGLLIFTNDGAFANGMTHPRYHVPKTYHVSVSPAATTHQLAAFAAGMEIDGETMAPAKAKILRTEPGRSVLEITLFEGKNREIRRMCKTLSLEVRRLSRVSVGVVRLGGLPAGSYRELTPAEIHSLKKAAGLTAPSPGRRAKQSGSNAKRESGRT